MRFKYTVPLHEQASIEELGSVLEAMYSVGGVTTEDRLVQEKEIKGYVDTEDVDGVIDNITMQIDDHEEAKSFMNGYSLAQKEIEINDYLRSLGWETAPTPFVLIER